MRVWSLKTARSSRGQGSVFHSSIGSGAVAMTCALLLGPLPSELRASVSISGALPPALASEAILRRRRLRLAPAPRIDHHGERRRVVPFLVSV
jgi:hypothetical protein